MAPRLNWDKDKKRELVWRRGALPYWQDGWAPEVRDAAGDLKDERGIETKRPGDARWTLTISGRPDVKLVYLFSSIELSHQEPILKAAHRLIECAPAEFFPHFRALLEFDYSYHG